MHHPNRINQAPACALCGSKKQVSTSSGSEGTNCYLCRSCEEKSKQVLIAQRQAKQDNIFLNRLASPTMNPPG